MGVVSRHAVGKLRRVRTREWVCETRFEAKQRQWNRCVARWTVLNAEVLNKFSLIIKCAAFFPRGRADILKVSSREIELEQEEMRKAVSAYSRVKKKLESYGKGSWASPACQQVEFRKSDPLTFWYIELYLDKWPSHFALRRQQTEEDVNQGMEASLVSLSKFWKRAVIRTARTGSSQRTEGAGKWAILSDDTVNPPGNHHGCL